MLIDYAWILEYLKQEYLKYNHGFEFYDFVNLYRYIRKELNRTGQLAFAVALFLRNPKSILDNYNHNVEFYNIICNVYRKYDLLIS